MQEKIEQKSINNAISAYLMIIASWLFLLNKDNKHINNDFVKKHTKSAIILHILFIAIYIIFIFNWLFNNIEIFSYWLNIIIADISFIWLFVIMIAWIFKASKWESFNIWSFIKASKSISLDTNQSKLAEKDKLTLVSSYIPFVWYIIWSKYDNKQIKDILTFNLFISLVITITYILWYWNLSTVLLLIYIIYWVFVWVNLFSRDELTSISLPDIFSPNSKLILQKNIVKYIKHYIKWDFKEFNKIVEQSKIEKENTDKIESEEINNLASIKIPEILIYIPYINLFTIFLKENNNKLHITNWLTITFISFLMIISDIFWYLPTKSLLLLLFPICFGLWNLSIKYYKMPFIYEISLFFKNFKKIFIKSKKSLKEKSKEVNETNLKVK